MTGPFASAEPSAAPLKGLMQTTLPGSQAVIEVDADGLSVKPGRTARRAEPLKDTEVEQLVEKAFRCIHGSQPSMPTC